MEKITESQENAQARVEQIHHFQQELAELQQQKICDISAEQQTEIEKYHHSLLLELQNRFDVDISQGEKHLSLGMKIASLIGALAMTMSIFFLFYQFWGQLFTSVQVGLLVGAPILSFFVTMRFIASNKSSYYVKIAALISLGCFVLNLSMLGQLFNVTPSPNAFLVWSLFAFVLAYACNARLLLFFAIMTLSSFIAMKMGTWSGLYWISFGERPEHFFLPALLLFLTPQIISHRSFLGFSSMYRILAMLLFFIPVLILANVGYLSYLSFESQTIEVLYLLIGFVAAAAMIWLGIKQNWSEVMHTGNVFFLLFLYTKFFDWWWDWMPKYLFFFVMGLTALLVLVVFKRLRVEQVLFKTPLKLAEGGSL